MYHRYQDRVDFLAVYIREAHPSDGWRSAKNDQVGITIEQPKTFETRTLVASRCCQSLGLSMPLVVDTIDDRTNRAYAAFPDRLYLVDREGRVAYKGGRGPYGYKPRELEQTLVMLLMDETASAGQGTPVEAPQPDAEPGSK
jgi:hypothetical protein